ncbi:aminopeptidase N [Corynebacterium sp. ES2730-CONJ]|uniref:aminopeptidase N n=1 Tax=Corynebacterium sp. ES2730-CONJ TaxID=2973941 RepID=UPI00216B5A61|nr:aminopeptidase N [Corynebacterium sp. ES2730-CONJ]MCS4532549.1 aminopeptidase N [Corynebacterium sp. ES2730-CONJ]
MSSINLTQVEAAQRSRMLHIKHYDFHIDITGDTHFPATTTVDFEVKEEGSTFIDLVASEVSSVTLDGEDITRQAVRNDNVYDATNGLSLDNLSVGSHQLTVVSTMEFSHTGQGLHRFVDPVDEEVYFYTQFEPADAKRVFACFDQPDLKATYSIHVTAPAHWKVITNAPQVMSEADKGVATFSSEIDYPLSTYLVAICSGDYHMASDLWHGTLTHHQETPAAEHTELEIPLAIYCRKSLSDHLDADAIFLETKQGFDFYHENFGMAYPFGKYDQLFVPEFNAGAMENAGAVTFRDEYIFTSKNTRTAYERRCETILHEMAHMWFGDLVTMRWWDDLWLNESFATWAACVSQSEATQYDTAWVTFATDTKAWAYKQDMLPSTHPISTDASDMETAEQNFDGITYAKGASVLKQLQAYVGREAFFAGVRQHFANHAFGNATFADLLHALSASSGRDLSDWAAQWLKTTGINELRADFSVQDNRYTSFALTQSGAHPGAGEYRTHRVAIGFYSLIDGQVVRTDRLEVDIDSERVELDQLIGHQAADLVLVNDDDLTYCLMKLDADSRDFAAKNIDRIADPMARTLIWSACWEMVRAGDMRARDFVDLVITGAPIETEISVLQRVLGQATQALEVYADPQWVKDTGAPRFSNALIDAAAAAEAGSDTQLAFVQELCANPLDDRGRALMRSIVDGEPELNGLVADHQLQWRALRALVAAGAVADLEAEILSLSTIDPSATGKLYAHLVRASENTATNKAAVFTEITEEGHRLSNTTLRYKMAGLTGLARPELLQQLNDRYFEKVPWLWDNLTSEVAQGVLAGLYPAWDISPEGVKRTQNFLDSHTISAGIRRILTEQQALVERAIRNRAVDAA